MACARLCWLTSPVAAGWAAWPSRCQAAGYGKSYCHCGQLLAAAAEMSQVNVIQATCNWAALHLPPPQTSVSSCCCYICGGTAQAKQRVQSCSTYMLPLATFTQYSSAHHQQNRWQLWPTQTASGFMEKKLYTTRCNTAYPLLRWFEAAKAAVRQAACKQHSPDGQLS